MPDIASFVFSFVVLIFSVVVHEVSHGLVAEKLGDPTARALGRITLNPIKHIDPFGSVILPLILALPMLFGAPTIIFGWAKPVPYNPMLLKNPRAAAGKIAVAGPISNILLALVFGLLIRGAVVLGAPTLIPLFALVVYINVLLAVFNLVPIPPLDGSKVLFAFLPPTEWARNLAFTLERYGFFILILFIFFGFQFISPLISGIFRLIAGSGIGF